MTKYETLKEKYFERLEENCVEFTQIDEAGNSFVTQDYNDKTIREMCEYLEMPEWVIDWTREAIALEISESIILLENGLIDTCTSYGIVRPTNIMESEVL
jgi:hypothetical protein